MRLHLLRLYAFVTLTLFVLMAESAHTQPAFMPENPRYIFQSIGDDQGLATRAVTSLMQDSKGFVWISTQDGLFRCDGSEVFRFDQKHGLIDTWVTQVEQGPDGAIWIVSGKGVFKLDGFVFRSVEEILGVQLPSLGENRAGRLAITSSNQLLIATVKGLWSLDAKGKKETRVWTKADGLPGDSIQSVHIDPAGQVWAVASNKVVSFFPKNPTITPHEVEGELEGDIVISMITDGAQRTWLRTQNHLYKREKLSSRFVPDDEAVAEALPIGVLGTDKSGSILVPSTVGMFFKEDDQWKKVSTQSGLRISGVSCAMEDSEGALWIGLVGAGVARWTGRKHWAAWTKSEGLPNDSVWGSLRDSQRRLWVGTNDGIGVWLPAEHRWKIISHGDGLAGHRIWKFAIGPDGFVCSISRRTGLNRFDPVTFESHPLKLPFEADVPYDITNGPDGSLWVATNNNLFTVDLVEGEYVFKKVELPQELVGSHEVISVADDGSVWIGGSKGLGRFDGTQWKLLDLGWKPGTHRVMNVVAVSEQEVWISDNKGNGAVHVQLEGKKLHKEIIDEARGLASNQVWMLQRDHKGRIWAGGADGLSLISKDLGVRVFDQGDGLIWNDISQGGFWAEEDGSVLIGTSRGLAYYNPSGDTLVERPPNVVITSALLGDVEALQKNNPTIDYDRNNFTIKFAGLTFRNPGRVSYQYRVLGWDNDLKNTRQRTLSYAALPPGNYTFEVWCRSAAGLRSDNAATFSFVVLSPWWERWWIRLGALVFVLALIAALVEIRTRRLAADRKRLEAAVTERSAQLASANEELRELSFTDALTGTRNRRFFSSVIDSDVAAVLRKYDERISKLPGEIPVPQNRDLLFFIIDLDHFKRINDIYGHPAGDAVLVEAAQRLQKALRQSDLLVRWGGEEFLILCRETERSEGSIIASRILNVIGQTPFVVSESESVHRTCSVGWAALPGYEWDPDVLTHETVVELADKALFVAKRSGRNRGVGVRLMQSGYEEGGNIGWLDERLEKMEGQTVLLTHVSGPDVSTNTKSSRSP